MYRPNRVRLSTRSLRTSRSLQTKITPITPKMVPQNNFSSQSFGTVNMKNPSLVLSEKPFSFPLNKTFATPSTTKFFGNVSQPLTFTFTRTFATYPPHVELGLPALSPTMETGNLAKWRKKEGDKISSGDVIAEIETDKATVDFEATDEGFLAKILAQEGAQSIRVGTAIAVVVEKKEDIAAFKDFKKEGAPAPKAAAPQAAPQATPQAPPKAPEAAPAPKQAPPAAPSGPRIPGVPPPPATPKSGFAASPLAKSVASQQGVDLTKVQGSGPNGRIIASDVNAAAQTKAAAPSVSVPLPGERYTDIPLSNIRKITAERLTFSKQSIPHYYLSIDVQVDEVLKVRKNLAEKGYKLSVNDFVVKASALALKKVPTVNSSWQDTFIRRYENVDINVAVNTDKGLLTPIVRNADLLGLAGINNTVKNLADKAREGKLAPQDFNGGTFTISNLGMFGIKTFSAVINPPQAAILAVGGSEERVIVDGKDKSFRTANLMSVTLSCDHRVVDGAVGAQWLQAFKEYIEDPLKLLL